MKPFLFLFFIVTISQQIHGQAFGEIQLQKSVAQFFYSKGPKDLIRTSLDLKKNYLLERADLVRIRGPVSFWDHKNKLTFDLSEVSFVNWNAGGSNSISGLVGLYFKRLYLKDDLKWSNELITRFGVNKQESQDVRKTDDNLEIVSTLGYRVTKDSNWFYSSKFSFKSQFSNGYNYPDRDKPISQFMAPGYLFLGSGAEFTSDDKKRIFYLSPLTLKSTFVLNQRLANQGAFGVREAEKDANGNIIREGKTSRVELGILVTNEITKEVLENVEVFSRLSLYSDYANNFGNVDIDWELNLNFKVNGYIKASFGSHLKYDDDIKIKVENSDGDMVEGGSRVQWKQQLGIGVVVEL
ncbi:DUF3078 domain-containing protein [Psychroflexus halocasei]|uniref:DUF3078 domain-containing protein n=1 Tax=Psychroflexus halocasei TaxID=908615 RepID=A0A1H3X2A9_9FLAO|nr:DUF3078 domain-containing protein [Psychroflexus halocasei]SDZ93545.1 Protein of unknown function [Psychroflexus halocasei]